MASTESFSLYQFSGCPFCTRVLHAAERLGVELELRDTLADSDHARDVLEATGGRSVPVLRIEDSEGGVRWLPESVEIIAYLEERFGS